MSNVMHFTIHVMLDKAAHLVDCGLTMDQACELALKLESLGYAYRIDLSGSSSEQLGSPLVYIAQLARSQAPSKIFEAA